MESQCWICPECGDDHGGDPGRCWRERLAAERIKRYEAESAYERLKGQMGDLLNGQSLAEWHEDRCGLSQAIREAKVAALREAEKHVRVGAFLEVGNESERLFNAIVSACGDAVASLIPSANPTEEDA